MYVVTSYLYILRDVFQNWNRLRTSRRDLVYEMKSYSRIQVYLRWQETQLLLNLVTIPRFFLPTCVLGRHEVILPLSSLTFTIQFTLHI